MGTAAARLEYGRGRRAGNGGGHRQRVSEGKDTDVKRKLEPRQTHLTTQ